MRLVGKDKQPLDFSQEQHKEVFLKSLQKYMAEMAQNEDGSKYGFMDIEDFVLQPYGTPYVV